jgi:GT2 family glycosyltransferase
LSWKTTNFLKSSFYDKGLGRFPSIERAFLIFRMGGFVELVRQVKLKLSARRNYVAWCRRRRLSEGEIEEIRIAIKSFARHPKISVLMPVYNVEKRYLERAIKSVLIQLYENWELCIADDHSRGGKIKRFLEEASFQEGRIKVKFLNKTNGIARASNAAAELATGEYITTLDNDDELSIDALYEVGKCINKEDPDFIYSDEDFITRSGKPVKAHFKPDFSPDLLCSHNYITHLMVIRKSIFDEIKGFSLEYDGAQDYDLVLKASEKARKIAHIPKILYHWRKSTGSSSANPRSKRYAVGAGRKGLEEALRRRGVKGQIFEGSEMFFYRVKRDLIHTPIVSVIIYNFRNSDKAGIALKSLIQKTGYSDYEIIALEDQTHVHAVGALPAEICGTGPRLKVIRGKRGRSLAGVLNQAANVAEGEHLVFIENNVEIITRDWMEALLEHSQREEVGVVGAKLLYPDETVYHAGIILGIGGFFGFSHRNFKRFDRGYYNRLNCIQNVSAVSGALMMVKKHLYEKMNGFDEKHFRQRYWDIDFCLRLLKMGYLNVYTPYCEAYYHTGKAPSSRTQGRKTGGLEIEREAFLARWSSLIAKGDPYYNPYLSLEREDFSLRMK